MKSGGIQMDQRPYGELFFLDSITKNKVIGEND